MLFSLLHFGQELLPSRLAAHLDKRCNSPFINYKFAILVPYEPESLVVTIFISCSMLAGFPEPIMVVSPQPGKSIMCYQKDLNFASCGLVAI